MTIFEAIRDDHETHRTVVDLLLETDGDSDGRRDWRGRVAIAKRRG